MTDPNRRADQVRRDYERRRQAEQLQDRADRLARQRERDREWRRLPTKSKATRLGWLVVFGFLALVFFSGGHSNNAGSTPDTNAVAEEATSLVKNAASVQQPEAGQHASPSEAVEPSVETGQSASEPQPAPTQAVDDDVPITGEQRRAAEAAFYSGRAERWESGDGAGYAVPSELAAGCRNITISTDADAASSRVINVCS